MQESRRSYLFIAGIILMGITLIRLVLVVKDWTDSSQPEAKSEHLVACQITGTLVGPVGDQARLLFPELPAGFDLELQDRDFTLILNFKSRRQPQVLKIQSFKSGVFLGETKELPFSATEGVDKVELGEVKIQKARALQDE